MVNKESLHIAVRQGDAQRVKSLLLRNPELVNLKDTDGRSALHHAANLTPESAGVSMVNALLSVGAEVDVFNNHHATPLHRAILSKNHAVSLALVEGGADVRARNKAGKSALELCVDGSLRESLLALTEARGAVSDRPLYNVPRSAGNTTKGPRGRAASLPASRFFAASRYSSAVNKTQDHLDLAQTPGRDDPAVLSEGIESSWRPIITPSQVCFVM
ncbi:hypothetical protein CYMTET_28873 [Cymbomonas tetramitiformis]|uniref:Uncharacterized protein n=1 Tax=Cymbomonas tetramitiformis TaxID=36881 RepID=A0AAE0FM39_9CHLO|nr:hypothetical protein CYMTET_28873 [Cymbomonas tetramitiformis]